MFIIDPSISPDVTKMAPGFRALSISVTAAPITNASIGETALRIACEEVITVNLTGHKPI